MNEHRQADISNLHKNQNALTPEYIEAGHKLREKLLYAIQTCEWEFDS